MTAIPPQAVTRQEDAHDYRPGLPPLPQYTCGVCGETFGTNFAEDEITCAYCEARRCPHCSKWFGGED